jgi:hypothetical protein
MSDSCFTRYCMAGLEKMYISSEHVFSASYRSVKGRLVNLRNREQEYKYTMNVLMGLHRARASGSRLFLDIEEDYHRLASRVEEQSGSAESVAATIWAGACLGTEIPSIAMSCFSNTFLASSQSRHLSAQALAWAIAACLELGGGHTETALTLARLAVDHYVHERSSLVRHLATGLRRDWASFAASSYMAYAFLMLGRVADSEWARSSGLGIARALVQLQGPQGQWGWFYQVPSGRVADYYPVYSVHQHSMAPFFLLEAIDQGHSEFREPLLRGFRWILGENELGQSMVETSERVIWRSALRRRDSSRLSRFARGARLVCRATQQGLGNGRVLIVNHECRSYELGWALWAFAGRRDFDEILNHASFC